MTVALQPVSDAQASATAADVEARILAVLREFEAAGRGAVMGYDIRVRTATFDLTERPVFRDTRVQTGDL